jgi:hypothetical protein
MPFARGRGLSRLPNRRVACAKFLEWEEDAPRRNILIGVSRIWLPTHPSSARSTLDGSYCTPVDARRELHQEKGKLIYIEAAGPRGPESLGALPRPAQRQRVQAARAVGQDARQPWP